MMIQRIYLDLDNVLNTLAPYILHTMGCPIASNSYAKYPSEFGYAIVDTTNHMLHANYTPEEFWAAVPQHIWAIVPRTPFFHELIELCRRAVGMQNVYIATSPTNEPACAAGKIEWMQEYLPPWLHRQFFITPCKHLLASPQSLLIDDCENNVVRFADYGGKVILVPRPWNVHRKSNSFDHIIDRMKTFSFRGN